MLQRMRQIGRRTAELHRALTSYPGVDGFAPEPISQEDSTRWSEAIMSRASHVAEMLQENRRPARRAGKSPRAKAEKSPRSDLSHIEGLKSTNFTGSKIRVHGDFHLGQVLIAKDDAYILDFEGEPRQSLDQRRVKEPPGARCRWIPSLDRLCHECRHRPGAQHNAPKSARGSVPGFAVGTLPPVSSVLEVVSRDTRADGYLASRRGQSAGAVATSFSSKRHSMRSNMRSPTGPAGRISHLRERCAFSQSAGSCHERTFRRRP